MKVSISPATAADIQAIVQIRNAVALQLTSEYGKGHWSSCVTERAVQRDLRDSEVLVARGDDVAVGTLRLASKKPWAIDTRYFTRVPKALYLHALAVDPLHQRCGIGRSLVTHAQTHARGVLGNSLRLDAYDSPAGAGKFYLSCGFQELGRVTYRTVPLLYFELLL